MVRWLHYTTAAEFALDTTRQDANAPAPGLFVYRDDQRAAVEEGWPGRRCIAIEAPDGTAVLVQSFADGEFRGPRGEPVAGFEEWFIPATVLALCRIDDEEAR